jgi:hypothetical protein
VPIIVTPNARAHWHAIRPTPPAAAWNRIVSPGFELAGLAEQILNGEALQHERRGNAIGDIRRKLDQPIGRHHARFAVRAERPAAVRDAIPGATRSTPGPTASTIPAASMPMPLGNGNLVNAGAMVRVDVVDADSQCDVRGLRRARRA